MRAFFLTTIVVALYLLGSGGCGKKNPSVPQKTVLELELTEITSTGISASWNAVLNANKYEVRYSTNSNMTEASTKETSSSSLLIDDLVAKTDYYVQVRAFIGGVYTEWSEIMNTKTATFTTTIGTYNMKSISNDIVHPDNKWFQRKEAFRDIIRQANNNPDVLGIEEGEDIEQINEAVGLLGDTYDHYIAERKISPRLVLWKKDKYSLVETGEYELLGDAYPNDTYIAQRYATYVRLREIQSQKDLRLFVIHPPYDANRQVVRNVLANKLAEIAVNMSLQNNNEPVFILGDFNNYPTTVIDGVIGSPMVFTERGFVDTFNATQYKTNANYGTMNDIVNALAEQGTNGSKRIDYIFFYPENKVTVSDYRIIINFASGSKVNLKTPIPSDHNPVRSTLNIF